MSTPTSNVGSDIGRLTGFWFPGKTVAHLCSSSSTDNDDRFLVVGISFAERLNAAGLLEDVGICPHHYVALVIGGNVELLQAVEPGKVLDIATGGIETGSVPRAAYHAIRVGSFAQAGSVVSAFAAECLQFPLPRFDQEARLFRVIELELFHLADLEVAAVAHCRLLHRGGVQC